MWRLFISEAKALTALQEQGEAYVTENLDVVERDDQAGKVKNLPSDTAAALRDDDRPRQSPYEAAETKRQQAAQAHAAQAQQEQARLEAPQESI